MAVGLSAYSANKVLDIIGNAGSWSGITDCYIKLHTADPGAAGTTSAATETTRKAVSFGASSGGVMTSNADVTWTSIAGSQDASHFSLWDDVSAGNFLGSGVITAAAYTAGDTFTLTSGNISLTLTIAS